MPVASVGLISPLDRPESPRTRCEVIYGRSFLGENAVFRARKCPVKKTHERDNNGLTTDVESGCDDALRDRL